jgi:hypothetical protein
MQPFNADWDGWSPAHRFDGSEQPKGRRARLFLISTGTLATAQLPFWLNWLTANRPLFSVTAGLTDSARRFVSPTAISALTSCPVTANTWGGADPGEQLAPIHNTIAHGYDAILVYPASVSFLSTLASGSGSTPFSLAILGARVPVVIAPSFPPGVLANPIIHRLLARIAGVPNYHLVKPHKGKSRSIDADTDVCAPLWDVIAALETVWPPETDRVPEMTLVEKG